MDEKPLVTVVMPIRNEGGFISRSLAAVLAQNYPHDRMEILVVDGLSTDGTREIVLGLKAQTEIEITLLDNPRGIVPTGLNIALEHVKGEIIVRVDGHCEVAPDYVGACVKHLLHSGADGVGGPIETVGATHVSRAIALAMSSPFGVGGSAFRTTNNREMLVDTIAFPGYTRKATELAGPFDEEMVRNQDDEYNYRLRSLGAKILLTPDIRSRYYSRADIRPLWRQYLQYGYWKVRVMQKHPRQMRARQFVPPVFVAALAGAALLSVLGANWIFLAIVWGSYLLANLGASLVTASKHGWRFLPLMPLLFATLHLSYGIGFLWGLLRFWNRWGDKTTRSASINQTLSPVKGSNNAISAKP